MRKSALSLVFLTFCDAALAATVSGYDGATGNQPSATDAAAVTSEPDPGTSGGLTGYVLSIDTIAAPVAAAPVITSDGAEAEQDISADQATSSFSTGDGTSSGQAAAAVSSTARTASSPVARSTAASQSVEVADDDPEVSTPASPPVRQTLDFDNHGVQINKGISFLKIGSATITNVSGDGLFIYNTGDYGMPEGGGFCGLAEDFSCTADLSIVFDAPVTDLTFSGFFANITDGVYLQVFRDLTVIYEGLFTGTSQDSTILFDLRGLILTSLFLFDRSDPETGGIAYGSFAFETYRTPDPIPTVPLPASVFLLLGALAGLRGLSVSRQNRIGMRMSHLGTAGRPAGTWAADPRVTSRTAGAGPSSL